MSRGEILWLAFEKFAIFFAFTVTLVLVLSLLAVGHTVWKMGSSFGTLRDDLACPLIVDVNQLVDDLDNAVITRTIPISQTIPIRFVLPVEQSLNVSLTDDVQVHEGASFVLPAGGGQINGTVFMALPEGQVLPVYMNMRVPVSQSLPVQMNVDVAIPLKETELGPVVAQLRDLLQPFMTLAEDALHCPAGPSASDRVRTP